MVLRLRQHNIGYTADGFYSISYLYKLSQQCTPVAQPAPATK